MEQSWFQMTLTSGRKGRDFESPWDARLGKEGQELLVLGPALFSPGRN